MRRKKYIRKLKHAAPVIVAGAVAAFFFLRPHATGPVAPPAPGKAAIGYKAEDRQRLEQLIHEGTEND